MKHYLGLREVPAPSGTEPGDGRIYYEPNRLITGHALLMGQSGTGKTTESKRILTTAANSGITVDAFDVHDEMEGLEGATAIRFSQHTRYGMNPLALKQDVHTGGPGRQIDLLVRLIKQISPWLGVRQESIVRNLCWEAYAAHGIKQDEPRTWQRTNATEQERVRQISSGSFLSSRRFYPTLEDVRELAQKKIIALAIGGSNDAVAAYTELRNATAKLHRLTTTTPRDEVEEGKLDLRVAEAKTRYKAAAEAWSESLTTGRELDEVMRYRSVDELQSILIRLDLLNDTGILRSNPPPFGDSTLRVHQLKSLTDEQQILYVRMELQRVFEGCKNLGPMRDNEPIRRMAYVDEAHRFFTKDPSDVINQIAKEARKFGLALVCASQQPTDFPRDFLSNVGATIVCGIHASFWRSSEGLLGISEDMLGRVRPRDLVAIKLQRARESNARFMLVHVPNMGTLAGRRAAMAANAA